MSTKHKSINPDTIDFSSTACHYNQKYKLSESISEKDRIEWYYNTGELCTSLLVSTVLEWVEDNKLHIPDHLEPYECDSLKWLDDNFELATEVYFMVVYAEESEVI